MLDLQNVVVGDLNIAYRRTGAAGRNLVFVHGWASSSRMWEATMHGLAETGACWALDLAGFGDSAKPLNGWYSIDNWARQVEQFIRQLEIERPVVVGHSMGGMIALALAAGRPQLTAGIALINPVVKGGNYRRARALLQSPLGRAVARIAARAWPVVVSPPLADPLGVRSSRSASFERNRSDWARVRGDTAINAVRAVVEYDATACLPHIRVPTLVVLGDRDSTAPNSHGRLVAERVPGAQLVCLHAGHLPTDDAPEATQRALLEFVHAIR